MEMTSANAKEPDECNELTVDMLEINERPGGEDYVRNRLS